MSRLAAVRRLIGRDAVLSVAVAVGTLHILHAARMRGPIALPDEFGYLATARQLVTGAGPPGTDYHPGLSLLLAPAAKIFGTPLATYRSALVINALLIAVAVYAAGSLARRLSSNRTAPFVAASAALYAPHVVYPGVAWAEPLLIAIHTGLVLSLVRALERPDSVRWLTVGSLAALAYTAHPRGAASIVATGLVVIVLRPGRQALTAAAAGAAGAAALTWPLVWWVTSGVMATRSNTVAHTFGKTLDADMAGRAIGTSAGQILAFVAATAGVAVLTAAVAASGGRRLVRGAATATDAAAVLVAALFAVSLATSGAFMSDATRADQLIYARYNDAVAFPLLVIGLTAGLRVASRRPWTTIGISTGIAVTAAAVSQLTLGSETLPKFMRLMVASIDLPVLLSGPAQPRAVLVAWTVGTTALLCLAARRHHHLAVGVAALVFAANAAPALADSFRATDLSAQQRTLAATMTPTGPGGLLPADVSCIAVDYSSTTSFTFYNYRWFADDVRVERYHASSGAPRCSDFVIADTSGSTLGTASKTLLATEEGADIALWRIG